MARMIMHWELIGHHVSRALSEWYATYAVGSRDALEFGRFLSELSGKKGSQFTADGSFRGAFDAAGPTQSAGALRDSVY